MADERIISEQRSVGTGTAMDAVLDVVAELCRDGRYREGHELLERSLPEGGLAPSPGGHPRLRSYYGLTLALALGELARGMAFCQEAVSARPEDPELLHNLGLVHLRDQRRELAVRIFSGLLARYPYFPPTRQVMQRLGQRRKPLFSSLPRSHPLNRVPGRLFHWVEQALTTRQPSGSHDAAS